MEIFNPGSSASGRSGFDWEVDTLRPDGGGVLVAGWSGTETDVDDVIPDGSGMASSTDGSQYRFTWDNLDSSLDADAVSGLVLRGRARNNDDGQVSVLKFYQRIFGTTNVALPAGEVSIYAGYNTTGESTPDWQEFVVPMPFDKNDTTDNLKWTESAINGSSNNDGEKDRGPHGAGDVGPRDRRGPYRLGGCY